MVNIISEFLFVNISTSILLTFVGVILHLGLFEKKSFSWFSNFASLAIGFLSIIVIFSLLKSNIYTLHFTFVIIFIFLIYIKKVVFNIHIYHMKYKIIETLKLSLRLFLFSIPFFIFNLYFSIQSNDFSLGTLYADDIFYGNMSNILNEHMVENCFYFLNEIKNTHEFYRMPYHYSELWFTSFVSLVSNLPHTLIFIFTTSPICQALSIFGIISLFEFFKPIKYKHIVLSFILVFVNVFWVYNYVDLHNLSDYLYTPFMYSELLANGKKLFVFVFVFLLSLNLWIREKVIESVIVFSCLTLLFFTVGATVVAILPFIVLYLFYSKRITKDELIKLLVVVCLMACCFFYYNIFFTTKYSSLQSMTLAFRILHPETFLISIKLYISGVLYSIYGLMIGYFPVCLLLVIGWYQSIRKFTSQSIQLILFCVILLIIGICVSHLLYPLDNYKQFYANLLPVINCIIVFFIIKYISNEEKSIKKNLILTGVFILIFNSIHQAYKIKVVQHEHIYPIVSADFMDKSKTIFEKYGYSKFIASENGLVTLDLRKNGAQPNAQFMLNPTNYVYSLFTPEVIDLNNDYYNSHREGYTETNLEFLNSTDMIINAQNSQRKTKEETIKKLFKKHEVQYIITDDTLLQNRFDFRILDSIFDTKSDVKLYRIQKL